MEIETRNRGAGVDIIATYSGRITTGAEQERILRNILSRVSIEPPSGMGVEDQAAFHIREYHEFYEGRPPTQKVLVMCRVRYQKKIT